MGRFSAPFLYLDVEMKIQNLIEKMPKAELHLHIEGTLEPELMFDLAKRNGLSLPYDSVDDIRAAYDFQDLQSFLDVYYQGMAVLQTEQDFFDLTFHYLQRCADQNIVYVEMFFDPQAHLSRGVAFETVLKGIIRAMEKAKTDLQVESQLILSILRHLDEDDGLKALDLAIAYQDYIVGIGLDSSERNNPPEKFRSLYQKARQAGFRLVAHAGEEGDASYVRGAVEVLRVERIDHGNNALQDMKLVAKLREMQMPLTLCPLSNLKLKVVEKVSEHPLLKMMNLGLKVTVNSDDPAYFDGYLVENYAAVQEAFQLKPNQLIELAKNSFEASFLSQERKAHYLEKLMHFSRKNRVLTGA